jgi:hypothetical protein
LPIVVAVSSGLIILADFFVTDPILDELGQRLVRWTMIVAAFALILGLVNLLSSHLRRVRRRQRGWPYSLILLAMTLIVVVAGAPGTQAYTFNWLFRNVQFPLQATFFALLAFFIATAAFRTFRARSFETLLMVVAGLLVLWGQAPISRLLGDWGPVVKEWILAVPTTAGARGILLGAALGIIATGLRVLLGFDRQYAE